MKKIEEFNKYLDSVRPNQPIDAEMSQLFVAIMMDQSGRFNQVVDDTFHEFKNMLGIQIFLKRLKVLSTVTVSFGAAALIGYLIENPAQAVMYAYYIHRNMNPNTKFDVEMFGRELFPLGVYSNEQLEQIWDAQKVRPEDVEGEISFSAPDNLLDYRKIWVK